MNTQVDSRMTVVDALLKQGARVQKYEEMLAATPPGYTINGLAPWWFMPTPERDIDYCSKAAGRPVLPFAQAVEEDMMACFKAEPGATPGVLVLNPWSNGWGLTVLADLPDFDAWLVYAEQVSREVQARKQEKADDE